MMVVKPDRNEFRFTGWHMAICMVAFFGVIIAVNVTMAITASSSWTGLVVKNSYVASQQFNRDLEAAKVQKAAGWKSEMTYQQGKLKAQITDAEGKPLTLTDGRIEIGRPAFEQQDQTIALVGQGAGTYSADLQLSTGEWFVRLKGMVGEKPYRRDALLWVGQDSSGKIR